MGVTLTSTCAFVLVAALRYLTRRLLLMLLLLLLVLGGVGAQAGAWGVLGGFGTRLLLRHLTGGTL